MKDFRKIRKVTIPCKATGVGTPKAGEKIPTPSSSSLVDESDAKNPSPLALRDPEIIGRRAGRRPEKREKWPRGPVSDLGDGRPLQAESKIGSSEDLFGRYQARPPEVREHHTKGRNFTRRSDV